MTVKLLLCGCSGAMGLELSRYVKTLNEFEIVAGVCRKTVCANELRYPLYTKLELVKEKCDVIIDFSSTSLLEQIIDYALKNKLGVVIGTTGYSQSEEEKIFSLSRQIPVFRAANLSLGVNKFMKILEFAVKLLENDYNIEIIENHSSKKIDSPSGTAKIIQRYISNNISYKPKYIYGRNGTEIRSNNEIGVHSIRGGNVAGMHAVLFEGEGDIIKLEHTSLTKKIFVQTAIDAVSYIRDKSCGYYVMDDLII